MWKFYSLVAIRIGIKIVLLKYKKYAIITILI